MKVKWKLLEKRVDSFFVCRVFGYNNNYDNNHTTIIITIKPAYYNEH